MANLQKFTECQNGYQKCCCNCFQKSPLKKIHAQQTNLELYGHVCTVHSDKFKDKVKQIIKEKYGTECYLASKECQEKAKQAIKIKYGEEYENIAQIPEIKHKIKESLNNRTEEELEKTRLKRKNTCQLKYGEDHWTKTQEWIDKFKLNYYNKTGYYNPQQNPNVLANRKAKYEYNNIKFDSSWELAYYIWLQDHNIHFKYHSDLYFTYIKDGKERKYFPDFVLDNCIIEIKSNYLISTNCKYKIPDEKINCMKNNNVIILQFAEIYPFLSYVKYKYGVNFIKNCKMGG